MTGGRTYRPTPTEVGHLSCFRVGSLRCSVYGRVVEGWLIMSINITSPCPMVRPSWVTRGGEGSQGGGGDLGWERVGCLRGGEWYRDRCVVQRSIE